MTDSSEAQRLLLRDVGVYMREVAKLEGQKASLMEEVERIEAAIADRTRISDEVWAIIHILRGGGGSA